MRLLGFVLPFLIASSMQAVTLTRGDILIADPLLEAILRIDPVTGEANLLTTGLAQISAIALDTNGDILVADSAARALLRVDPLTGTQTLISSGLQSPNGLKRPWDVAIDGNGSLLVADDNLNAIVRVDRVTGSLATVVQISRPREIAVEADGQLLVASSRDGIYRVDPIAGTKVLLARMPFSEFVGLATEPTGDILAADSYTIYRLDPLTGATKSVIRSSGSSSFGPITEIAVDSQGAILVADYRNAIFRVDPATGASTAVSVFPTRGVGLTFDEDGDIIVATADDSIRRVDPINGVQTVVATGGLVGPFGIVLDGNQRLIIADTSGIVLLDPSAGTENAISTFQGFSPMGITLGANGDAFVSGSIVAGSLEAAVLRIDLNTGEQSLVSAGGKLSNPFGIATEASGDLLVADPGTGLGSGGIIRIDPDTGAQTMVPPDENVFFPFAIAVDSNGDLLVGNLYQLVRIDPATGFMLETYTGFVDPIGVAIDASGVFVADVGTATVSRIDLDTSARTVVSSGLIFPFGIAVVVPEPSISLLVGIGMVGLAIVRLRARWLCSVIASPHRSAERCEGDKSQSCWCGASRELLRAAAVARRRGRTMRRMSLAAAIVCAPLALTPQPARSAASWVYFSQDGSSENAIHRLGLESGALQPIQGSGLAGPIGVAVDLIGGKVYWADQ
jgi:streptogramin lyase